MPNFITRIDDIDLAVEYEGFYDDLELVSVCIDGTEDDLLPMLQTRITDLLYSLAENDAMGNLAEAVDFAEQMLDDRDRAQSVREALK
jgi:hypothetical protein